MLSSLVRCFIVSFNIIPKSEQFGSFLIYTIIQTLSCNSEVWANIGGARLRKDKNMLSKQKELFSETEKIFNEYIKVIIAISEKL